MRTQCYICEKEVVPIQGLKQRDILFIVPEIKHLTMPGGFHALKKLFFSVSGIDIERCSYAALHNHEADDGCLEATVNGLASMFDKYSIVVLFGEAVSAFTEYSAEATSGIVITTDWTSARILCSDSPGTVFMTIGELNLVAKKLKQMVEE